MGRKIYGSTELTPTEQRIANMIRPGVMSKEIAAVLYVTEKTIKFHLTSIYRKLGVKSRYELYEKLSKEQV